MRTVAQGGTISDATREGRTYYSTQMYKRWTVWKHQHPLEAARLKRQSVKSKAEKRIGLAAARLAVLRAPAIVLSRELPPADQVLALIEAAIAPLRLSDEIRSEVRQNLAVDVLERRVDCSADSLRARALRSLYFRDYADPWGNRSLDEVQQDGSDLTLNGMPLRSLWEG